MKKIIFLTLIFIMITSTLVFADVDYKTYSVEFYLPGVGYRIYTSTEPIYYNSSIQQLQSSGITSKYYKTNLSDNYLFAQDYSGTQTYGYTAEILQSSHDIYDYGTSTIFFQRPLQPLEAGMEGALPNLLQSLLVILPIILGMCLLVIGFRKAWAMLSRVLARA